ncbi:MAG TPA: MarR family transcriptional regulator [Solirubrobacteraceae bacterium]|nr:MarR family transcriptional regulator [Solirubrobacteraceae bacterium]
MSVTTGSALGAQEAVRARAAAADVQRAELAARLRRTAVRLSRRLRRHAASGLSPSLESALAAVGRCGPLAPSELAALEDVRRPSATRMIGALECRGLVERSPDPDDGRSHRVAATPAGRALLADARSRRDAYLGRALARLAPQELAALDRALGLIERVLAEPGR